MPATHYFIVMRDHGRYGREAMVDPETTRRGMIDALASDAGANMTFVHEIRDYGDNQGLVATNITEEVAREVMTRWAMRGEPLSAREREFIEQHVGIQAANSFVQEREDA